jgi:hypothetical protein
VSRACRSAVRWRTAAGIAGLLLATAASGAEPAREELRALRAEILQLIGNAPCANLVHCRALALGSRPCGGPAEYLTYSSFSNNRELIEAKAFEYTFLHEELQREDQAVGACAVLPQPRLQCVDRRCRIENAAP